MNVQGKPTRTIWLHPKNKKIVQIIDQRALPHHWVIEDLHTVADAAIAIKDMHVRGAGLIGATAGFGIYLAVIECLEKGLDFDFIQESAKLLMAMRPTAVNLEVAVTQQLKTLTDSASRDDFLETALRTALLIADNDAEACRCIGLHGVSLIEEISKKKDRKPVNILTHCNAGWLAFVDYGSATSPIYTAHDRGIPVHVWVDETRPRCQGSKLTAWELGEHGVPHTIIADNTGGHLMQHGMVDLVIVGADRTTRTGDVANKIGTYLKALAAKDNNIPFYVAMPSTTFDWVMRDGVKEIPIEERGSEEVNYAEGLYEGKNCEVLLAPKNSPAMNFGFDVTPARLITGLITERGMCYASEPSILYHYPDFA